MRTRKSRNFVRRSYADAYAYAWHFGGVVEWWNGGMVEWFSSASVVSRPSTDWDCTVDILDYSSFVLSFLSRESPA